MTEAARPARRRRPHVAAGARVVVVGAATAGTLAMVGLMTEPPTEVTGGPDVAPAAVAPAMDPAAPVPPRIVVVRRHHPAPAATAAAPAVARTSPTPTRVAAPAPAPAPRPAAPTTTSGGS